MNWKLENSENLPFGSYFANYIQVQGLIENFRDKCGGPEGWLDDKTYYTAFTEGWALYAESPLIAESTSIYDDNPIQKYGMFKWQVINRTHIITQFSES